LRIVRIPNFLFSKDTADTFPGIRLVLHNKEKALYTDG